MSTLQLHSLDFVCVMLPKFVKTTPNQGYKANMMVVSATEFGVVR